MITGPWKPGSVWFEAGANDADAVLAGGQLYRLITSLTLHADFTHLAGNCLIGGMLFYFFLQINGAGFGLLAVLLSGATGNLINDLAHGSEHFSVGFSTAIFAIIGMLSMYQMVEQRQPFGIRLFVPFMAGAALLAMLGSSGERTDLGSHLFGLLSGLIIGLFIALKPVKQLRQSSFMQIAFFIMAIIMLIFSWSSALSTKMG
jgi:membrane associated rhomboid family serine protease